MNIPISFTITSCNRLNLLEKTIYSFLSLNDYPIDEFILSDDSADDETSQRINDLFGKQFTIIKNEARLGLSKSLDNLFLKSKNEYIFHCEDDWFFEKNRNFISNSLEILEENKNIHQVHIRHKNDYFHPQSDEIMMTKNLTPYRLLSDSYKTNYGQSWNGYSWNPGLRRKSDYLRMFPNGISFFGDEYDCSSHTRKFNYLSASLEETCCYHIGKIRTNNFII
jgi:GT2 family glycosyltransferase